MTDKHQYIPAPKTHLKLHRIGRKYMLVETPEGCANLTNVYSMNETAAWLWQKICNGEKHTAEKLAHGLCQEYKVDPDRALHDVEHQLETWKMMGLLS